MNEWIATECEEAIIETKIQAPKSEIVERKRFGTDDTHLKQTSMASSTTEVYEPREYKDPIVNNGNEETRTLEETETRGRHLRKFFIRENKINDEKVSIKEFAVEEIVGKPQKNGRAHYVVPRYE